MSVSEVFLIEVWTLPRRSQKKRKENNVNVPEKNCLSLSVNEEERVIFQNFISQVFLKLNVQIFNLLSAGNTHLLNLILIIVTIYLKSRQHASKNRS